MVSNSSLVEPKPYVGLHLTGEPVLERLTAHVALPEEPRAHDLVVGIPHAPHEVRLLASGHRRRVRERRYVLAEDHGLKPILFELEPLLLGTVRHQTLDQLRPDIHATSFIQLQYT